MKIRTCRECPALRTAWPRRAYAAPTCNLAPQSGDDAIDSIDTRPEWCPLNDGPVTLDASGCPSDIAWGRMKEYAVALAGWDKPRMGIYFVKARSEGAALRAAVVERDEPKPQPAGDPREWENGFDYHYAIAVVEPEWGKWGRRETLSDVCNSCTAQIHESVCDDD